MLGMEMIGLSDAGDRGDISHGGLTSWWCRSHGDRGTV